MKHAVTMFAVSATTALGAPRDIQIRSVDFDSGVVELFNFGTTPETLTGWRFCTHDEDQVRRYSSSSGLNAVTVPAGGSHFIHFLNDAPGGNSINISSIGGNFALPLDNGAYGMNLYVNSSFGDGNSIADHLQWSINGIDNVSADERSDEAEAGGVWTDQALWIATNAGSTKIDLDDATGSVLHGPGDYTVSGGACSVADCNGDGGLNLDDIDCFIAGFLANDVGIADCDASGTLNLDDIDCFVSSFLAGCP